MHHFEQSMFSSGDRPWGRAGGSLPVSTTLVLSCKLWFCFLADLSYTKAIAVPRLQRNHLSSSLAPALSAQNSPVPASKPCGCLPSSDQYLEHVQSCRKGLSTSGANGNHHLHHKSIPAQLHAAPCPAHILPAHLWISMKLLQQRDALFTIQCARGFLVLFAPSYLIQGRFGIWRGFFFPAAFMVHHS